MNANLKKAVSLAMVGILGITGGVYYNSCKQKTNAADENVVVPCNLDKLLNPTVPSSAESNWQGNYIYFGHYPQTSDGNGGFITEPIKWRVLDKNNEKFSSAFAAYAGKQNAPIGKDGILLLSDKVLDRNQYYPVFDTDNVKANLAWAGNNNRGSTLWAWLNGYGKDKVLDNAEIEYADTNFTRAFNNLENSCILITKVNTNDVGRLANYCPDNTLTRSNNNRASISDDKIFLLSIEEALNTNYGFLDTNDTNKARTFSETDYADSRYKESVSRFMAYLRSPGYYTKTCCSLQLQASGDFSNDGYRVVNYSGIVPALNFDKESVLFISKADNTDKVETVGSVPTAFNLTSAVGNEYKLTIKDSNRNFKIDEEKTTQEGQILRLAYKDAQAGNNEYVSCVIYSKDAPSDIIYYGKLGKANSASGTVNLRLPIEVQNGKYNLAVFNEQCNGANETDWSSAPIILGIDENGKANLPYNEPIFPEIETVSISPSSHSKSKSNAQDAIVTIAGKNFSSNFKVYVAFKKKGENEVLFKYPESGQQFSDLTPNSFSIKIPKEKLESLSQVGIYTVQAFVESD